MDSTTHHAPSTSSSLPLRPPAAHQSILAAPALTRFSELLQANRGRFRAANVDLLGRSLSDLRTLASAEAMAAADNFMTALALPLPKHPSRELVLCGHQPDLFHPGVWIKNFAIHALATRHGLTPMNVIIDGDVAKAAAIRVPVCSDRIHAVQPNQSDHDNRQVGVESVPFDRWAGAIPFEELTARDEELFERFPAEVEKRLAAWGLKPLVTKLWRPMGALTKRTKNLGERLTAARRWCEQDWGCQNLEVPMSRLCRSEAFGWFGRHLLAELPRFHEIYNQCLHDYRRRHRIRSRNHPVPDLHRQEDWIEAPFWVWPVGGTQRERLFALRLGNSVELSYSGRCFARIPLNPTGDPVRPWQQLELQGFKIRSRATTTTLFLRLFLADAFVHGIGGSIYDELTDEIIRQFYGTEPPGFMTLSGTLLLPPGAALPPDNRRPHRQHQLLRDLWFNPDRHLEGLSAADQGVADLVRQKQDWIARHPTDPAERHQQFMAIHQVNDQLRPLLQEKRAQLEHEEAADDDKRRAINILKSREYAFCLHSEGELRRFVDSLKDML